MMNQRTPHIVNFAIALCLLLGSSCSFAPPETAGTARTTDQSGEVLFAAAAAAYDSTHYANALRQAKLLIADRPAFPRMEEVYLIAARSSHSLGRCDEAVAFSELISGRFPLSQHVAEANVIAAECLFELGRYFESIERATRVLIASPIPGHAKRAALIQDAAKSRLSPGEIERLLAQHPSAPVGEELALDVARREFASGDYENAYAILADLLYRFPEHPRAPEMRRLLKIASERRTAAAPSQCMVDPYTIGLLLPVTGNFSLYGRYFEQGVTLAVDSYNERAAHPVTLVQADSKASPVESAKAARKLILEDGVLAIVGGVLAMPTVTAAVEANAWGVPLLSPVVTDDELSDVGRWIFQTTISGEIEVTAIAKCAIETLLFTRFAVLAPAVGEKHQLALFFEREVTSLGGSVVSMQFFEPRSTDFKEQLEAIVMSSPEALFIPASSDELINILPQIRFYDVQARLLGLSDWNTDKLIRLSNLEIEGALFPLETYHGKNAVAYERFLALHREKIGEEINPFTIAGYFGMLTVLKAVEQGMADREEVRAFLSEELYGDAEKRRGEAAALTILTVHNGTVMEFTPASR